jgi:FOG: FHA domain
MEVMYKRDMNHNYLVLEGEEDIGSESYQVRMLDTNQIPGLMKCSVRILDNVTYFYYEITSKQPLTRVYEITNIAYDGLVKIFMGLRKAIDGAKIFLLEVDYILLDPAYIYMDLESGEVVFCYYPTEKKQLEHSFGNLTEYILNRLDHNDMKGVVCGYEIYKSTLEENYNMDQIMKILHRNHEMKLPVFLEEEEVRSKEIEQAGEEEGFFEKNGNQISLRSTILKTLTFIGVAGVIMVLFYIFILNVIQLTNITPIQIGGFLFLIIAIFVYFVLIWQSKKKDIQPVSRQEKKHEIQFQEYRENKNEGQVFGETVVLKAQKVKKRIWLQSEEPDKFPHIEIEQNQLMIGKLLEMADVVIEHPSISRLHAKVTFKDEFYITDLNSTNGTYINEQILKANEERSAKNGDIVKFADLTYTLKIEE